MEEKSASDVFKPTWNETTQLAVGQFVGLLWLTEYSARLADTHRGSPLEVAHATNTLFAASAALEALVLETTHATNSTLYKVRCFRRGGITQQYEEFLRESGRTPHPAIFEISKHRNALTHSEPDHERSRLVGEVLTARCAAKFAVDVRLVAVWLWDGARPMPVAADFDAPNPYL